ncbi:hypothetical protein VA7868_02473 [Vibrio aerogenes CECT 7868]|uniref:Uncharacterized protein n=1 Tax=Vibrio aerogenes CECT 7868 TaxID=1216006 RepID=A0A1M5ZA35_9VIBR|nr:hypothetical protein VA7868_02473 [Vibrio aerogenes CECT 7868]
MHHAIEFVETSVFTRQIKLLATENELIKLQIELIVQPDKGVLIQGTGGSVKSEWPQETGEKVAVYESSIFWLMPKKYIYYWHTQRMRKRH